MIQDNTLKLTGAIQLRGGIAEVLRYKNPLLEPREIMVETDTGKIKVGNGVRAWNDLSYSCGIELPPSDDKFYAMKNGEWTEINI